MMAPEIATEAMRAYAEETNRLNCERQSNADGWPVEQVKVEKQTRGIIEAIKKGMFHPRLRAEMHTLEARKAELASLLCDLPGDKPDLLPSALAIYARKVGHLIDALNRPEEQLEAAEALLAEQAAHHGDPPFDLALRQARDSAGIADKQKATCMAGGLLSF